MRHSLVLQRQAAAVVQQLDTVGRATVQGAGALYLVQRAIQLASAEGVLEVRFDPGTPATIEQYLAGAVVGGVQGAVAGAGAGLVAEVILGAVGGPLIAFGLVMGGLLGAAAGVDEVHRGWRFVVHLDRFRRVSAIEVIAIAA